MAELYANQTEFAATITLTAGINAVVTTIPVSVAAPASLHGGQFRVRIGDELLLVTAGQNTTSWTATRGAEGSTAATHSSGATVRHLLTAASLLAVESGSGGAGVILPWATATEYVQGQPVTNSGHTYTANDAHTAGATFAGDLAGHWTLLPVAVADVTGAAPLASPALTGNPTAPTPAPGDNDTSIATSAFVKAALDALVAAAPGALDTLDELAAALGDDANFAATITTALAGKANNVETVNTVAAAGSTETLPDVTTATIHRLTLDSATCTLTFPTAAAGKSFTVILTQDATGGRLVTWPGSILWPSGSTPALTTTPAKRDVFSFMCADGTNWLGFVAAQNL